METKPMNIEPKKNEKPPFKSTRELKQMNESQLISIIQNFQEYVDPVRAKKVEGRRKSNKDRPLNWEKFSLRHVAFKVVYLGWSYQGLATQKDIDNTIESSLIAALQQCKLIEGVKECNWSRSGRTDKGVSAFCQVIAIYVRSNIKEGVGIIRSGSLVEEGNEEHDYLKMLNGNLPDDIRVIGWTPVDNSFNARFSANRREYKYYFIKEDMDVELMKTAAQGLVGEHDYRNFCKMDLTSVTHFTRRIHDVKIEPVPLSLYRSELDREWSNMYVITIRGSAFLWHQVRCIVAILFMVGKKLEAPSIVSELLDISKYSSKPIYLPASDIPLVLYECGYENLKFNADFKAIAYLFRHFFDMWKVYSIKTTMIESLIGIISQEYYELPESKNLPIWEGTKEFQIVPNGQSKTHIQLSERNTEASFDERLERLDPTKKIKLTNGLSVSKTANGGMIEDEE